MLEDNLKKTIAKNLKKLRQELGFSVLNLADKIEMSANTLSAYEREIRTPSIELGIQLYAKLNVNLNWFISGNGEMFINECENTHVFINNDECVTRFKNWGNRLNKILAENEETPRDFSKRTGIKESRIEDFILNSAEPTMSEINSIKSNIDVSIDELFYGETVNKKESTQKSGLSAEEIFRIRKLLKNSNI